ncbi:acetoacetate--CoA ligase [Nocardioides fonticola]|uniref:Acetoacetate--CoA ligase n=1 Tax=Nocardioides fonticola TaxID=450363 RepID=A0ABP7XW36_9ACTN
MLTASRIGRFATYAAAHHGLVLRRPGDVAAVRADLQAWSTTDLEAFWRAVASFQGLRIDPASTTPGSILEPGPGPTGMPGARWLPGATLNYADQLLHPPRAVDDPEHRAERPDRVVLLGRSQTRDDLDLTLADLRTEVARAAQALRALGVRRGDRVAAYLPNIPETVVAFLATASLGAVWASCALEFGPRAVIDRFAQIEPTVLLVAGGYRYGGRHHDRRDHVAAIRAELPTVRSVIDVGYGGAVPDSLGWRDLLDGDAAPLVAEQVPADHPLVVLFSSGTTGLPKAIVHGHGGLLLEQAKSHGLLWDLGPDDRMLWYSTTAWMMWNALVATLLVGGSIVLLDGDPGHPDLGHQWRLAARTRTTLMGASPGFLTACRRAGVHPVEEARAVGGDLDALRVLGSAGAPLAPEGYTWVAEELPGVQLAVGSGGTDVCSGLVQGDPLLPVWPGEISGAALGVAAAAWDDEGRPVVGALGELVVTAPMPSMPLGLWGDPDGARLRATYFDRWPGIWRHGDWIRFEERGSCHVAGRSDATLNRGGVRLGTAELYGVLETVPQIADSLVVHLEDPEGGNGELLLFVQPGPGLTVDDALRQEIAARLRSELSPRHVPDAVLEVPVVPRNLTGKRLELPVKRILQGAEPDAVASRDALADPDSLAPYVALAAQRPSRTATPIGAGR